jgi:predicted amidohydrolase YtcJ
VVGVLTAITTPVVAAADLILHGGKVFTADADLRIAEALAVEGERITAVGTDAQLLRLRAPSTTVVDLQGKSVLPGLIDSHVHPVGASLHEFEHDVPAMATINDVLRYVGTRANALPEGRWIIVQQVFITRLAEQRYPTRAELDAAAPRHPVMFRTGPDVSLNTLALKLSGIDRNFKVTDGSGGFAELDPATGEPTGILRNCRRYVKVEDPQTKPTPGDQRRRLRDLLLDYAASGITMVCDRDASSDHLALYQDLRSANELPVRVRISRHVDSTGNWTAIEQAVQKVADHALFRQGDDRLRIIGIKTYLDGGMLTGSAYMRAPWGVSTIYGITDPDYRGVRFIPPQRLEAMVRAAMERDLQFTAHAVGDGAVHALLETYSQVAQDTPIRPGGACISHSNFMSRKSVEQAARLGVVVDIQPAWLWLDTRTLAKHFGEDRLRYFQPLRSLFEAGAVAGGGSDHMQKIGSMRSINPYNPFLGMATAVTRKAHGYAGRLHLEEGLTREQVIQFYTINNARVLRCADRLGSLEPGKLADLVVVDTDLLTCADESIASTQVLATYIGGQLVFRLNGADE